MVIKAPLQCLLYDESTHHPSRQAVLPFTSCYLGDCRDVRGASSARSTAITALTLSGISAILRARYSRWGKSGLSVSSWTELKRDEAAEIRVNVNFKYL